MMNTEKQPLLLLPPTRNLVFSDSDGKPHIVEIPEWLAGYMGYTAQNLIGEPADKVLEPLIPGICELIKCTGDSSACMGGFRAVITDTAGERHQLLLDSVKKHGTNNQDFTHVLIQEVASAPPKLLENATFCGLIGTSEKMQQVFNKVRMYAASEAAVLVTGETGAGKEGIAAAIHKLSRRSGGPFVTMNCSAITDTLFESELFGHEKGSFTGAIKSHRGRFERADGGTLFLDEIGDLPALSQAKLLRVLETSQIERVGSETPTRVNVRIIAATNHNLEKASQANTFRADLYYRINALQIKVPPLRERVEDIELLIQHFIKILNERYERNISCLTREAVHLLRQYQWPGNVRELRNLMERLFAENQSDVIGLRSLKEWYEERLSAARYAGVADYTDVTMLPHRTAIPLGMAGKNGSVPVSSEKKLTEEDLRQAYQKAGGNITRASEILGVHKATFYRTLKSLNLERGDLSASQL
ncbi:MAG: sigma-54-dependent Fis family transcriptional regulator [Erysipelotrichia bacterium]|nr:sigma-54 dependent transcriptional regulator [Candidatus Riflebacteria bacterium]NCB38704.1 sigma-54-dependent Fis family transcriptional regulator [Erysipelotrichia bacterium]